MKYKEPKTIKEQIKYLKDEKRVVFNIISEEEAEAILEKYGYINVITPFKHIFAKKSKGEVIKMDNKHVYENDIEFKFYFDKYEEERKMYPVLFDVISTFETTFNAIVSQKIAKYYSIDSKKAFDAFTDKLILNLVANEDITHQAKKHMMEEISDFKTKLERYGSIYIFLDRLSLNSIITIYKSSDPIVKNDIFKTLIHHEATLEYYDMPTFDDFLTRLVRIRNYVYHNNSLEILYRYFNIKKNSLRTDTDRRRYKNIVKKLVKTNKTALAVFPYPFGPSVLLLYDIR